MSGYSYTPATPGGFNAGPRIVHTSAPNTQPPGVQSIYRAQPRPPSNAGGYGAHPSHASHSSLPGSPYPPHNPHHAQTMYPGYPQGGYNPQPQQQAPHIRPEPHHAASFPGPPPQHPSRPHSTSFPGSAPPSHAHQQQHPYSGANPPPRPQHANTYPTAPLLPQRPNVYTPAPPRPPQQQNPYPTAPPPPQPSAYPGMSGTPTPPAQPPRPTSHMYPSPGASNSQRPTYGGGHSPQPSYSNGPSPQPAYTQPSFTQGPSPQPSFNAGPSPQPSYNARPSAQPAYNNMPPPPTPTQPSAPPQPPPAQPSTPTSTNSTPGYTPTGYTPTGYHGAPGTQSPETFYGSLINTNCEPSELYCRMSDALYFLMDRQCEIPTLRGTGMIEPEKYAWMMLSIGQSEENVSLAMDALKIYYECANVPHRMVMARTGKQVPVLDRRGLLHLNVFDARSGPDDAHKDWSNILNKFSLIDPLTNTPFPTPIPRTAFPSFADPVLKQKIEQFQVQAIAVIFQAQLEKKQAENDAIMQSFNQSIANSMSYITKPQANPYAAMFANPYAGLDADAGISSALLNNYAANMNLGGGDTGGGGMGGGGNEHATKLDAATAALNLASGVVSAMNGGSSDGGGGLGGLAALLAGGLGGGLFS